MEVAYALGFQLHVSTAVARGVTRLRHAMWHVVPLLYSLRMAPTIVRDGPFRLFFFSREETRIHVHVAHPEGEAKFWLTPNVHLAVNIGLSPTQLRLAQAVVTAHLQEIKDAWRHHFGS